MSDIEQSRMKARDLKVSPCSLRDIRQFVETNHYSHSVNGVKITQCFRVEHDGVLVGGVIYGALSTTAWKKFADEEHKVLELRRLVLVDAAGKNSESRVIGWTIRWIRRNLKLVDVIVSYADPAFGHTGIIYRASNFSLIGKTADDKGFKDQDTGKTYHSRALRTKYRGEYKPFVKILREKHAAGRLIENILPGKFCYVMRIRP